MHASPFSTRLHVWRHQGRGQCRAGVLRARRTRKRRGSGGVIGASRGGESRPGALLRAVSVLPRLEPVLAPVETGAAGRSVTRRVGSVEKTGVGLGGVGLSRGPWGRGGGIRGTPMEGPGLGGIRKTLGVLEGRIYAGGVARNEEGQATGIWGWSQDEASRGVKGGNEPGWGVSSGS